MKDIYMVMYKGLVFLFKCILVIIFSLLIFQVISGCSVIDDIGEGVEFPPPFNLQAVFSDGIIILIWENDNTDEEEFSIEKLSEVSDSYEEISRADENSVSYWDPDWAYNEHLYYRIRVGSSGLFKYCRNHCAGI
jgi:hypothetical protein